MHFVTSSAGEPHVQSYNFAHMNAGIVGNGAYLLQVRDRMAATMVNSNTLRILGGDAVCCGRHIAIDEAFEEVNIDNGVPGYSRIDLVVAHIETAPQETLELRVIKGEETTGTPVVPGHIDGDLNDGDTVTEMPICSVRIDGINPQEPVSLLRELTTLASLKAECDEHWDSLSQVENTHRMKSTNGQKDDVYWFLYRDSNGLKRLAFCSDEHGSGAGSHGSVYLNNPPFVTRSVSRSFSVADQGYFEVQTSPPAVPGYTYLGLVGARQAVSAKINLFSFAPNYAGWINWGGAMSGTVTFTLLYGRNGS